MAWLFSTFKRSGKVGWWISDGADHEIGESAIFGSEAAARADAARVVRGGMEALSIHEAVVAPPPPSFPPPPPPDPGTGKLLVGINRSNDTGAPTDGTQAQQSVDDYEKWLGAPVQVAHQFATPNQFGAGEQCWVTGCWTLNALDRWAAWLDAEPGRLLMLTVAPGHYRTDGGLDRSRTAAIANGAADDNVRRFQDAVLVRGIANRVVERRWHESNYGPILEGYPWKACPEFGPAFDRVSALLAPARAAGMKVAYSYGSAAYTSLPYSPDVYAPKPESYDILIPDYYFLSAAWRLEQIKADFANLTAFNADKGKKVWLGEFAPWSPQDCTDAAALESYQWVMEQVDAGRLHGLIGFEQLARHVLAGQYPQTAAYYQTACAARA